jgi:hypothetical protein
LWGLAGEFGHFRKYRNGISLGQMNRPDGSRARWCRMNDA